MRAVRQRDLTYRSGPLVCASARARSRPRPALRSSPPEARRHVRSGSGRSHLRPPCWSDATRLPLERGSILLWWQRTVAPILRHHSIRSTVMSALVATCSRALLRIVLIRSAALWSGARVAARCVFHRPYFAFPRQIIGLVLQRHTLRNRHRVCSDFPHEGGRRQRTTRC